MMTINDIEKKWQKYWDDNNTFVAKNNSDKEKYFYLVEFPYPSGSGLHVGHVRSYTAIDTMARKKRMMGYNVLFPMGWDAFGAPAEQYAIKNHIHPKEAVAENIKTFKGQIKDLGISFDWSREFSTTDPEYYKWTQWQFIKFYEHDMAYKAKKSINWCPNCKTGLSNEDSSGGTCERCGSVVVQKEKDQWVLRMSDYAEDLITGLDETDFQERIKTAQINWIGKSTGAEVDFKIKEIDEKLKVYTTRPDTLYGVTFMVIAPEHPYIDLYSGIINNMNEIIDYREKTNFKTEFERLNMTKEKTGVRIDGLTAINPITNKEIPIYISDYVMMNYGTGAIMAVPAHDDRDYEFASKFNIEIIPVIEQITGEQRENEEQKNSIVAVIYDEENNKYLTLNWKELGGRLFIGGTRKDNETALETAVREIKEETGYTDIRFIKEISPINHHYFAYNKNKAYEIESIGLLFKLISDKKETNNLDEDEKGKFEIEWVSREIIEKEVKDELHITTFRNLLAENNYYAGDGKMVNSGILNGLTNKKESINKMLEYLEKEGIGYKKTNYKLQDWIFTRQRFWGEPIPLVCCDECGWVPVKEEDLPVLLPDVAEYEPTDDGESPLAKIESWVNTTCPKCGKPAKRETDTMPNWAGSSWYWLRYMDPKNDKEFVSKEALNYWGQLDWYNGGMEHATRHLLYARFWNQFLYNIGLVPYKEPFKTRVAHGMILGEGGEKMSKSKGNVINPDDVVKKQGADALRCYEMFIGDYEKEAAWSEQSLNGCRRFLDKVIKLQDKLNNSDEYSSSLEKIINKTIKKVTEDIDNMKFNTAVSALMILTNEMTDKEEISQKDYRTLLTLLNPIAPHITEELNEINHLGNPLCESAWPTYDEEKIIDEEKEIAVQVNGKLRGTIICAINDTEEEIKEKALSDSNVQKHLEEKEIVKVIVIKNRIVNIVAK
ncbi:MAG: class I tRNA ligase family protein [Bacilli bacterium]|nr:class I tRNA ligase family protein [Bacilli bacterium]